MPGRSIHIAVAASALVACAAAFPAAAQDSPWSGLYLGANIGGNWSDSSVKASVAPGNGAIVIPPADIALINATGGDGSNKFGFTGGIEGGVNILMGNWLLGVETDFGALDLNQRITNTFSSAIPLSPVNYTLNQRAKTNWVWTVRPRLGFVAGPWLFYGMGGMAMSDIKVKLEFADNRTPPNTIASDHSKTKTGWTAGLGAGYAFTPNWSVKGEWLYADFGSVSTTFTNPTGFVSVTSKAKVRSNIARVGVDYRF